MRVHTFSGGPFGQNGYLAVCEEAGEAVVVDPGGGAPAMVDHLKRSGITPARVLLTHAHLDHIDGIGDVRAAFPGPPIHLHPADRPLYEAAPRQCAAFGLPPFRPATPRPRAGGRTADPVWELRVRGAPCARPFSRTRHPVRPARRARSGRGRHLRRLDRPHRSARWRLPTLIESIRREVLTLPLHTRLLSGHGPETTVEWEGRHNPFLIPHYGGELA